MQHARLERALGDWPEQAEEESLRVALGIQAVFYLETLPLLRAPPQILARLGMQVRLAISLANARSDCTS